MIGHILFSLMTCRTPTLLPRGYLQAGSRAPRGKQLWSTKDPTPPRAAAVLPPFLSFLFLISVFWRYMYILCYFVRSRGVYLSLLHKSARGFGLGVAESEGHQGSRQSITFKHQINLALHMCWLDKKHFSHDDSQSCLSEARCLHDFFSKKYLFQVKTDWRLGLTRGNKGK